LEVIIVYFKSFKLTKQSPIGEQSEERSEMMDKTGLQKACDFWRELRSDEAFLHPGLSLSFSAASNLTQVPSAL
jgi:hypothetical protein